jgi:hypothetical protein
MIVIVIRFLSFLSTAPEYRQPNLLCYPFPATSGRMYIYTMERDWTRKEAKEAVSFGGSNMQSVTGFRFLDLPAELRNMIYRILLVCNQPLTPCRLDPDSILSLQREYATFHCSRISQVSRQLRRETLPIFYSCNTFHFHNFVWDATLMRLSLFPELFGKLIGTVKASMIRSISFDLLFRDQTLASGSKWLNSVEINLVITKDCSKLDIYCNRLLSDVAENMTRENIDSLAGHVVDGRYTGLNLMNVAIGLSRRNETDKYFLPRHIQMEGTPFAKEDVLGNYKLRDRANVDLPAPSSPGPTPAVWNGPSSFWNVLVRCIFH